MNLIYAFVFLITQVNRPPDPFCEQVQACLNKMHEDKHYHYLEQSNLIVVKDNNTQYCTDLHFGRKRIRLVNIAPSSIKKYASKKDIINNERHLIIAPLSEKTGIKLFIRLANVKQVLVFKLTKAGNIWKANIIERGIS